MRINDVSVIIDIIVLIGVIDILILINYVIFQIITGAIQ